MATARLIIATLHSPAEQVAGKSLNISPPEAVTVGRITSSALQVGATADYGDSAMAMVSHDERGSQVSIYESFCKEPLAFQQAVLAHELGHVVDVAEAGKRPATGLSWQDRPAEIEATRQGLKIMAAAGLDVRAMQVFYSHTSEKYQRAAGLKD